MAQHIYSGSGAPTTTPAGIGHHFIDTSNKQSYISVGTSTSADWKSTAGGAEAITLLVEVYNQTGSTLTKGTVVYINGAHASLPTVAKAQADVDLTSSKTLGLIKTDISNNASGFVVASGLIGDLDTSAFVAGSAIYLSPTTAGAYTNVEPITPDHSVYLGVISYSHPTQGKIEIKVQNGYELSEIHDVLITAVAGGQVIQWDAVNGYWKNVTLDSGDISDFTTAARSAAVVNTLAGSETDQAPSVSATNTALSGKEPTLTKGNLTETVSSVLTITGGSNAIIGSGVTIEVDQADASNDGYLSSTDWSTFNNKEPALSKGNLSEITSSVLTITGGTNAVIGSGVTIEVDQADNTNDGYLSSTDWNTFNNKEPALTKGNLSGTSPISVSNGTNAVIGTGASVSIATADATTTGALTSTDWNTFNNKEPAVTKGNLTETTSSVLTITGGTNAVIGSGVTIEVDQADASNDGYLSSTDWTTFNNKLTTAVQTINKAGDPALTGAVTLSAGSNVTLTQVGNDIEIAATGGGGGGGVTSLGPTGGTPITGAVTLTEGTNVTISQSGQEITIAAANTSGITMAESLGYFGDGSSGSLSISSGTTTLVNDAFYTDLTISGTAKLNPRSARVFVSGTLDLSNAPTDAISVSGANGSSATSSTGGTRGSAVGYASNSNFFAQSNPTAIAGVNGANGGATAGTSTSNQVTTALFKACALGASGGNGGAGTAGAGGTGGNALTNVDYSAATEISLSRYFHVFTKDYFAYNDAFSSTTIGYPTRGHNALSGVGGGGGGGGSAAGGGGGGSGSGAGGIFISCKTLKTGASTPSDCITAKGGNGGDGFSSSVGAGGGGGGGGGGGLVVIFCGERDGSSVSDLINVTGGKGGDGGTSTHAGSNGGYAGGGGQSGIAVVKNFTTGTYSISTVQAQIGTVANSGATGGTATTPTSATLTV